MHLSVIEVGEYRDKSTQGGLNITFNTGRCELLKVAPYEDKVLQFTHDFIIDKIESIMRI